MIRKRRFSGTRFYPGKMSMLVDYNLAGKTAIVTGVSRRIGIGAAIALALARAGANVFTTYFRPYDGPGSDPEEAEQIVADLCREGVVARGLEADLADPKTPALLFDRAESLLGPVDILVNNATQDILTNIYSLTASLLDTHYAVNVRGAALLCAEFARRHDGRPGGRIINLTSGKGLEPMPENLAYALTKGAVEALTTGLSAALASKGVTVNAVDPGGTDTGWMSDELRTEIAARTLGGRVGAPEDAARIIVFLASSQAGWITGQIMRSRGGV